MYGRISLGPRAQLRPMLNSGAWDADMANASTVWPVSVRPLKSVIVPETMIGIAPCATPSVSNASMMAHNAALALRVSKTVSTSSTSTPPSINASACAR